MTKQSESRLLPFTGVKLINGGWSLHVFFLLMHAQSKKLYLSSCLDVGWEANYKKINAELRFKKKYGLFESGFSGLKV